MLYSKIIPSFQFCNDVNKELIGTPYGKPICYKVEVEETEGSMSIYEL